MKHYPLHFRLDGNDRYLIWSTDDEGNAPDSIHVHADGSLLTFADVSTLLRFADRQSLAVVASKTPVLHDIDASLIWTVGDVSSTLHCNNALNVWNLYTDAAATIPTRAKMLGDLLSGHLRLNEMLFYGSNLPAITPKGKQYSPDWSDNDILN